MKILYFAIIITALLTLSACRFLPYITGEKENVRYRETYDPFG